MKLLKSILFLFVFTLGINHSNAQVYSFKTSSLSVMDRNEKGGWNNWTDFKKAEIIINFDPKKDRFVVNSKDLQLYKIQEYMQKVSNEDDDTLGFDCLDNDNVRCIILIVTRKKENNRKQFYIIYSDLKMVYNIYDSIKI